MKKIGFFIFTFLFFIFVFDVSAHVLKTDGSIGAVVHIDPEDDPVVGEETTIYFDVKDTTNKFAVENCNCIFVAKVSGEKVYEQKLTGTTATYNFPEQNIYTLELIGTPKSEGQFQPFNLSYDVRVERVNEDLSGTDNLEQSNLITFIKNHIPHIFIISFVAVTCAFIIFREYKRRL